MLYVRIRKSGLFKRVLEKPLRKIVSPVVVSLLDTIRLNVYMHRTYVYIMIERSTLETIDRTNHLEKLVQITFSQDRGQFRFR